MPLQIQRMLKQFGFEQCKSVAHPMMSGTIPCEDDSFEAPEKDFDMQSLVGHASYIQQCCRPDISQVVKILSRYTTKFGKRHVEYAKHLLRYLKGTVALGLMYTARFPVFLQIFTDASHASCVDTRRSITSVVVKLGGNTVFWKNAYTSMVCHSSTESELMALDVGAMLSQGLKFVIEAMGGPTQECTQVLVDNQGTISLSSNPVQPGRNLHVHARYFYVKDLVYGKDVIVCYLPTELQIADVGCTFKGGPVFIRLREFLMKCARILHDEHKVPNWDMA